MALAEIAMLSEDPIAKLELMLGSEEGASMHAVAQLDFNNPVTRMIVAEMDCFRDETFQFARRLLVGIMDARKIGPTASEAQEPVIQPENQACCDADCGHKIETLLVVVSVGTRLGIETAEQVLSAVTLVAEHGMMWNRYFARSL